MVQGKHPFDNPVEPKEKHGYDRCMEEQLPKVYGIGNPLIDIIVEVLERDLDLLGIHKGAMHLIDEERRSVLLDHIKDKEPTFSCGGSCPNTIITLAALGIDATLAGKVGDDEYGKIYQGRLQELGVHNELVCCKEPTGSSIILITPDSERTMNTFLGANKFFADADVDIDTVRASDYFHFTGYMWDTPLQKSSIKLALKIAAESNVKVSFDIADPLAVGRNRDEFLNLITESVDVVFANSEEARILFDNYDAYECCKSMGKLCEIAVVKNGKRGSFVSYGKNVIRIPVQGPQNPVDTTGAGDMYAAGFLYGLCKNLSIEDSGHAASYLAGEIIQQRGAQFSKQKAREVRTRLERHQFL